MEHLSSLFRTLFKLRSMRGLCNVNAVFGNVNLWRFWISFVAWANFFSYCSVLMLESFIVEPSFQTFISLSTRKMHFATVQHNIVTSKCWKNTLKRQNLILKNATRMLFIFLFFLPKKQFGLLTDVHKVIQGKFHECFQRKEEKIKKEMAASEIFTSDKRERWCYLSSFLLFYFCCFLFSVFWLFFLFASIISF